MLSIWELQAARSRQPQQADLHAVRQQQQPHYHSWLAACRYLVRAEASDAAGGWSSRDLEVIVRKIGDTGGAAPCCR
jgi:hypothetical protein